MWVLLAGLGCTAGTDDPLDAPTTPDTAAPDAPGDTSAPEPTPGPEPLQLCVNELMADNDGSYDTGTAEPADWIELHNPTSVDVDLRGWAVTDDADDADEHVLTESVVVPAGGFLVLMADGQPELGPTHLDFSLDATGEEVGLFRPDGWGEIVRFGVVLDDIAVARTTDCGPVDELVHVFGGTPGASNSGPEVVVERLVEAGSTWRYLDEADAPGSWRDVAYDDSGWASGPAPLGYGDPHILTELGFGPDPDDKYLLALFRSDFELVELASVEGLVVGVMRDDGAAVFLNGSELLRDNLPSGPLSPTTVAEEAVNNAAETVFLEFDLEPTLLVEGTNVLAVEVHQRMKTGDDLGFDLWLDVRRSPAR